MPIRPHSSSLSNLRVYVWYVSHLCLEPGLSWTPFPGQITARTGHYRYLVLAGYSLWTVAQGLQCTIHQSSSEGKIIGSLFMAGIASGMTFQTTLLAAQVRRSECSMN